MPLFSSAWRASLRRSCPASFNKHSTAYRAMSTNDLCLSVSPPLPSRYRVRHVTPADRSACVRIIAHAFMYHNHIDMVHNEPSAVYLPIASLVFDHCMNEQHNLSFLITDTQHTIRPPATGDTAHTVDHDADRASLDDTDVAACILNYDASRSPDLDSLKSNAVYTNTRLANDFILFDTLYRSPDLRTNPPPTTTPTPAGHTVDCFFLATKCHYAGSGLATALCRLLYSEARRLGYRALETSASHPATAHIFMGGLGEDVVGVVTQRVVPSELVVVGKGEDGSEERPWRGLKDDVVCVHVPIEQPSKEEECISLTMD